MDLFAQIAKNPAKYDCLKPVNVITLEGLDITPFHCIALIIFICAIIHTLSANTLHSWARELEHKLSPKRQAKNLGRSLSIQTLYFLSEIEIAFAFWAIPLFIAIGMHYDWNTALIYINTRDYTEPLFVIVILALASTRPIIRAAETSLRWIANGFGGSLSAWWFTLLTLGPLLGSFITEVGAMALSALLLSRQFYEFRPSRRLAYATLGLLFVNISVGGLLTTFASPAAIILSHAWELTTTDIFAIFGWKAALGIIISNTLYWFHFRKEFALLDERKHLSSQIIHQESRDSGPIPAWITAIHILFMFFIVITSQYPAIFISTFLFFIGFHHATRPYQSSLNLTRPLLVGLFLGGLVIHAGLQGWWVVRALQGLSPLSVMGMSMILTAFNDNTAISYLATLVPDWGALFKYALFTGVIAGGGLTVIANAPNPAGFAILSKHFDNSISSYKLFLAALLPTIILYVIFFLFGPLF